MKIKEGFQLRDVCGEKVLTPQGLSNINFNSLIALNSTSAYLYENLCKREAFEVNDMVELLLAEYDVTTEQAHTDCENLAKQWKEIGLCE